MRAPRAKNLPLILVWSLIVVCGASTPALPDKQESEPESLTVAVVSSNSVFCDPNANFKHFESLIREAAGKGARLVCFPELALMAYSTEKEILDVAEEIPGPSTEKLEAIAQSLDVYLSVGMAEKAGEKYHIAQAVIGPEGYIGKYRKSIRKRSAGHRSSRAGYGPDNSARPHREDDRRDSQEAPVGARSAFRTEAPSQRIEPSENCRYGKRFVLAEAR